VIYNRLLLIFSLLIQSISLAVAQEEINTSENIGDCYGAIKIPIDEQIEPTFTGYAGTEDDLSKWSDSLSLKTFNSLWLTFKAPLNGSLHLQGDLEILPLELLIFKLDVNETCNELQEKKVKLLFQKEYKIASKLDTNFRLKKGEAIYLYFNTSEETKKNLNLKASFQIEDKEGASASLMVKEDLRTDISQPSFQIKVRDAKTKLPVESRIIVSESKNFNALYTASDMYINRSGYLKFEMKVDAPGYLFKDVSVNVRNEEQKELTVYLNPLEKNQEIELEGIQFLPQSVIFTEEAKPKLRRVRDFLALNKDVNIEIQGHVHRMGKNTWKSKRVSKKRAEKVKDYLIQNGIEGSRMTTKGFGNSKMKFTEPESDEERSANRRVEIKIK
jgi:outer membrane protein OmpA-like peptidoglycan-associated protein